jgi:hypothetical protein
MIVTAVNICCKNRFYFEPISEKYLYIPGFPDLTESEPNKIQ